MFEEILGDNKKIKKDIKIEGYKFKNCLVFKVILYDSNGDGHRYGRKINFEGKDFNEKIDLVNKLLETFSRKINGLSKDNSFMQKIKEIDTGFYNF